MNYGIYMRKPDTTKAFKRHCKIDRTRKGLLIAHPIIYYTLGDAKFEAELLQNLGYEVKIKEVK